MNYRRRSGKRISVPIPTDNDGFIGRECPQTECEGYFKIEPGTGLQGNSLPCHCPYCGHTDDHSNFRTKEQFKYAKSVAKRKIVTALHKDLKRFEFDYKPKDFGIGVSMKVKPGRPTPIYTYREKHLETDVICANCTLRYSVYGIFAFCPDCGQHNSLQILCKNLDLVEKILDLSINQEKAIADKLIENALEDCVSAFDGFGRELCHIHAKKAKNPSQVGKISFQNLEKTREKTREMFEIDLTAIATMGEWKEAITAFQKRHLIAHKSGVVDSDYLDKTSDTSAVVGRKICIQVEEVHSLVRFIRKLAPFLFNELQNLGKR